MKTLKALIYKTENNFISKVINTLKNNSFDLDICTSKSTFFELIYDNNYDIYIIEVEENDKSQLDLIKLLNEYKDKTLKMVFASKPNIIKASFLYGCDESILNDTDEKEILLRIKALIRRQFKTHFDFVNIQNNIKYDIFKKRLLKDKVEILIGEKPLQIIDHLLKSRGVFVSSENLENGVYPTSSNNKSGSLRYHIHKIRQLIGDDIIISNRTNGYKIDIK